MKIEAKFSGAELHDIERALDDYAVQVDSREAPRVERLKKRVAALRTGTVKTRRPGKPGTKAKARPAPAYGLGGIPARIKKKK